jgi:DNA-binding transcriptional ArsR family regulator
MNSVFKALSHPLRRRIVAMLREQPMSSGEIASAFDEAWPTITGHLAVLRDAGLVESEKEGTSIRYWLSISAIEEALAFLLDLAETSKDAAGVKQRRKGKKHETQA